MSAFKKLLSFLHVTAQSWDAVFATTCPICRTARAWVEIGCIVLLFIFILLVHNANKKLDILIDLTRTVRAEILTSEIRRVNDIIERIENEDNL